MTLLYLHIKGRTGLLMNNPAAMLVQGEEEEPEPGTPTKRGAAKKPSMAEVAKAKLYLTPEGNLYVPAEAVRKCLLTASIGYTVRTTGKKRDVALKPIIAGSISLVVPLFPILDLNGEPKKGDDYEVDVRRTVNPTTKGANPCARPLVNNWTMLCWFNADMRRLEVATMEMITRDAGTYPGLLDYRPEHDGWFGTFELVKVWTEDGKEGQQ